MTTPVGESALAYVERELAGRVPTRMVPDLERVGDLLDLLGSPQRTYPSIHVTGTNGKTSTARMVDALLGELGLRTGRYTSPHLESITERIALGNAPLSAERFAVAYSEVAPYAELVDARHPDRLTYFELLTAMAFAAFADAPVDAAVVEVGLGGRWDATNLISAPVVVVTPIGLDHTELLGSSVDQIAAEKAGIVHPGARVVTARQPDEAAAALAHRAAEVGASLLREGIEYGVADRQVAVGGQLLRLFGLSGQYDELFLPLYGAHQAGNAANALAAVEAFLGAENRGRLNLDSVRAGFAGVDSPGRLEVRRGRPTLLMDAAHNPAGVRALVAAVAEAFDFDRLVGVVAVLADKEARGMLEALEPLLSSVVVTTNSSPRALSAGALAEIAGEVFGWERVEVAGRLDAALQAARDLATEGPGSGGVLVTGSIVTVGEVRARLAGSAR